MKSFRTPIVLLLTSLLLALVMRPALALEIPPPGSLTYIQTNGPNANVDLGDWYSANGSGGGFHYFSVNIPCNWPNNLDVHIDLFSPEMNATNVLEDEPEMGGSGNTTFELYGPGTPIGPGPADPGPGAPGSFGAVNYPPSAAAPTWVRFQTLAAPVQCGDYILRAQTGTDDQNAWRLRVGFDNDGDPNNAPPANLDNPDNQPGTNDEITIGMAQTTYQHDVVAAGVDQCLTLYQFVGAGQATVTFNNFDLDGNQRVRYYGPSDVYDPLAMAGGTVGTVSINQSWNGPGAGQNVRVGDTINNPEPGWWRIVTCVNNHNQYIQEGQFGELTFYNQPPTPRMVVSKDDGETVVSPGDTLNYTITFANTSDQPPPNPPVPGAALNVTLVDTIPPNTTFVSCAINAPYTGTCNFAAGAVTFTLNEPVFAGATGSVVTTITVDGAAPAPGSITNTVVLDYSDSGGRDYPPETATDTDTLEPPSPTPPGPPTATDTPPGVLPSDTPDLNNPSPTPGIGTPSATPFGTPPLSGTATATLLPGQVSLIKQVDPPFALPGDTVVWTLIVRNPGPDSATNLVLTDRIPDAFEVLSATTTSGTVTINGQELRFEQASLAAGATVTIRITTRIRDNTRPPYVLDNVASLTSDGFPPSIGRARLTSAGSLPATGEADRNTMLMFMLLALAGAFGAVMVGIGVARSRRE